MVNTEKRVNVNIITVVVWSLFYTYVHMFLSPEELWCVTYAALKKLVLRVTYAVKISTTS